MHICPETRTKLMDLIASKRINEQAKLYCSLRLKIFNKINTEFNSSEHSPEDLTDMVGDVIIEFITENGINFIHSK